MQVFNTRSTRYRTLLPALALLSIPSTPFAAGLCDGLTQTECRSLASRNVYALLGNNTIAFIYGSKVISVGRPNLDIDGNLIGLDFRPSQATATRNASIGLYGITDTGKVYSLFGDGAQLVSTLTPTFEGGFQSLADFNPAANALRVIGSNDQNFNVANGSGNLDATVVQTAVTYAAGDTAAGRDPNLTGGAHSNNVAGAGNTTFYALDYARDTLVTTADTGASAIANGRLKTIGKIVDGAGKAVNIAPEAGLDIYTDQSVGNVAIFSNGQKLYFINLSTVNASLPVGNTQTVVAHELGADVTPFVSLIQPAPGAFMDVAVSPLSVLDNPADLALKLAFNINSFTNGQPFTFEVQVTNQGPSSQDGTTFFSQGFPFKDPVVTTSQGSCTLGKLTTSGKPFQCALGTLGFGDTATVKVTVSRVADAFAGATELKTSFFARGPEGGLTLLPGDPDASNNTLVTVIQPRR